MNENAANNSDVRPAGDAPWTAKQLVASLRLSSLTESIVNAAVRDIETLPPDQRWKIYRDLETTFAGRAVDIEKSYPLPKP